MKENYTPPTRKQVVAEILRHSAEKDSLKKAGKEAKDFLFNSVREFVVFNAIPYYIPTYFRKTRNLKSTNKPDKVLNGKRVGADVGLFLGCFGIGAQTAGYGYLFLTQGNLKPLIPFVALNLASGGYELGRKLFKDAEKRLITRTKLEEIALDSKNLFSPEDTGFELDYLDLGLDDTGVGLDCPELGLDSFDDSENRISP